MTDSANPDPSLIDPTERPPSVSVASAIKSLRKRLTALDSAKRVRVLKRSGVAESTLRGVLSADWSPPTVRNLKNLEDALAEEEKDALAKEKAER